jgi:Tol biopolymer transport system component
MSVIFARIAFLLIAAFFLVGAALARGFAQPEVNWQVVFTATDAGYGNASYVVNTDGSDTRQITYAGAALHNVTCSPNGQYFAFIAEDILHVLGMDGIEVLQAPVSPYTLYTETDVAGLSVSVTNNGQVLLFRPGVQAEGVAFAYGETQMLQMTSSGQYFSEASVAPDGESLALVEYKDGVYSIVLMPYPGLDDRRQIPSAFMPAWTWDGVLLFGSRNGRVLYLMDVERDQRFSVRLPEKWAAHYTPTSSPDGTMIAYMRYGYQSEVRSRSRLYLLNLRSGTETWLTESPLEPYDMCFLAGRPEGLEYGI